MLAARISNADPITSYDLTVTVLNDTANEESVTADSITFYYQSTGTVAVDSHGNTATCINCHEKTFNLSSTKYFMVVKAAHYVPKNKSVTVDSNSHVMVYLTYDNIPPITTASVSQTANANGWYNSAVTVTLTATDNVGGAGVAYTKYKVNNGAESTYTAPFSVSTEGTDTISYYSVDKAQNTEAANTGTVKIDKTVPAVGSLSAFTEANGSSITDSKWQNDNTPYFTWTFTDSLSGIDGYSFAMDVNADNVSDTTNTFYQYTTALADGKHVFHVKAVDKAGNWGVEQIFEIWIDTTAPTFSGISASPASPTTYSPGGNYSFSINWTDADSGIKEVVLTFDGKNYTYVNGQVTKNGNDFTVTMKDLAAGNYDYVWSATDNAGNTKRTETLAYSVNKAVPDVSLSITPSRNEKYGTQTTATCTITAGDPEAILSLYRDGTNVFGMLVLNGTSPLSDSIVLDAGSHSYYCTYTESQNYTGKTFDVQTLTISKAVPAIRLYIDGFEGNVTRERGAVVDVTAVLDVTGNVSIHVDGNLKRYDSYNYSTASEKLGVHEVTASFAGNGNYYPAEVTYYVTVQDTVAPVLDLTSPLEGQVFNDTLQVWLTSNEKLGSATGSVDGGDIFTLAYDSSLDMWSYTIIGLAQGPHKLLVTAYDVAGLNSTASRNFSILDTVAPTIDPLTVSNSTPNPGDMVTFTAVVKDNVAVKNVTMNGTPMSFVGNDTWTFNHTIPNATGTYYMPVQAFDPTGNGRTRNVTITVDLNATVPVIITIEPLPPPSGGGGNGGGNGNGGGGNGGSGNGGQSFESDAVSITSAPSVIDAQAGKPYVFEVKIRNAGTRNQTNVGLSINGAPAGWFSIGSKVADLGAGDNASIFVTINVPSTEQAGFRYLTLGVSDDQNVTASWVSTLNINAASQPPVNQTNNTGGNQTAPSGITGAFTAAIGSPITWIIIVLIVGGAVWYFYGDRIRAMLALKKEPEIENPTGI